MAKKKVEIDIHEYNIIEDLRRVIESSGYGHVSFTYCLMLVITEGIKHSDNFMAEHLNEHNA